jgi:hypothetical protein
MNTFLLIILFYINLRIIVLIETVRSQNTKQFKLHSIIQWIFFVGIISFIVLLCTVIKWYYVVLIFIISILDPILNLNPKLYFSLKQKIMTFIMKNYVSIVVYFIIQSLSIIYTLIETFGLFK